MKMAEDITNHHRYSDLALHRHQWDKAGQCTTRRYIGQDLQEAMVASTLILELVMVRGRWGEGKARPGKAHQDTRHTKDKDKAWTQEGTNSKCDQDKPPRHMERSRDQACRIVGILQTHRKLQDRIETASNDQTSTKVKAKWHSNHSRAHSLRAQMHCRIMPLH